MNTEDFFNLFLLISAIHGFLFSILILFAKNGREKSILYINLLVLSISLNNIESWVIVKGFFTEYSFLGYTRIPWHFLSASFFYMFLIHYLKIANRSKNILKLIIPIFLIVIIIRVFFVYLYSNQDNSDLTFIFERYTIIEGMVSFVFSLSIFGYAYVILKRKRYLFQKILSFDNLNWIHTFFKIGVFIYISWAIALVAKVYLSFTELAHPYYPLRIGTTILIYWSGYQAIIQLRFLKERRKLRMQLQYNDTDKKELPPFSKSLKFEFIHQQIEARKLFTMPKLTLESLAKEFNTNAVQLSSTIRTHTTKGFTDYLNEFRVALAKELLSDNTYENYTIMAIGLESGFNSKSTFFHIFKKQTGLTPSQYQKKESEKH